MSKLKEYMKNKMWRMTSGVLYKIKDRDGNAIPFIPNKHQLEFYQAKQKYNLIIIPKARQLGFSTAEQLWDFDDFLFNRNFNCGIIADSQDIAVTIFRDKIRFARDNLPEVLTYKGEELPIKKYFQVNTDRSNELSISNTGSVISVGTSYRGGTLQRLHISEFGKICNKYPRKAEEIMTGALQTVALTQKIVMESTAMGPEGYFYELCKKAKEIQDAGREPNQMERKLLFFPWWLEEGYRLEGNILIPQEDEIYFQELADKQNIILDQEQKNWYVMKRSVLGDHMFREYPSYFDEAFNMTIKGAYYERELTHARQQQRIGKILYDPHLQVHTARDIGGAGGGDNTAIRFFQTYANEIRFIDFREGNGRSMLEILDTIVKPKGYNYGKFYGPHDMAVVEYSTGESRRATAHKYGFSFEILQKISIDEGINTVRQLFSSMWFNEEKCTHGLNMLSTYRRAWDETNGVFKDSPAKNGTQHCADAMRYACTAIAMSRGTTGEASIDTLYEDL